MPAERLCAFAACVSDQQKVSAKVDDRKKKREEAKREIFVSGKNNQAPRSSSSSSTSAGIKSRKAPRIESDANFKTRKNLGKNANFSDDREAHPHHVILSYIIRLHKTQTSWACCV